MNDAKLGSWSVAESPITIEYSLIVIEEIRREVTHGYQRLSRGGIEVGGVLYGTHEESTVRIMAMRPISCEHARGPAFLLSDRDRVELHDQLRNDPQDARLQGMTSVGWFLSHTRSEITLADSDLETYSIFFFPLRGRLRSWSARAVEPCGEASSYAKRTARLKTNTAIWNSTFRTGWRGFWSALPAGAPGNERLTGALRVIPPPNPASAPATQPDAIPSGTPPAVSDPVSPGASSEAPLGRAPAAPRRRWLWLAPWAIAVAAAGYVAAHAWMLHTTGASEPISLAIAEREGQLQIEWNHDAAPVEFATGGSLEIIDGGEARTVPLTRQILTQGRFTYVRKTGDVEVRMTVNSATGAKVQEASRFLGRPSAGPGASEDLKALQQRRDELEAEVKRLSLENSGQAAHIRQLERTLLILETRLGIDQGKQP